MDELKQEFNSLIDRYKKANKWFEDSRRTVEEQDKYIGEFNKILDDISRVTMSLKQEGIELTSAEFERGFE